MNQTKKIRIVGISITTSEATAPQDIGALWGKAAVSGVLSGDSYNYGVYCDYEDGRHGNYRVVVGSESDAEPAAGQVVIEIPVGSYEVIEDEGAVEQIVGAAWQQAWTNYGEKRSFAVDYERYLGSPEHSKFGLYIGVV
ncbi:MAG: effector binding domain-containing protein [Kofleriaceae bacterium]|nr:effector binding domain-containing protein [Kofleriaceae bacterium]